MGVREEEAERRFCFLNDRAGCGGVEYAAGLLLEVCARPRFAIELIYSSMRGSATVAGQSEIWFACCDWSAMSDDDVFGVRPAMTATLVPTSLCLCYQHTNGTLLASGRC